MKKMTLWCLLAICAAVPLTNCVPTAPDFCSRCHNVTGGTRIRISYPNGETAFAIANNNGCVVFSPRGFTCGQIETQPMTGTRLFFASPSAFNLQAPPSAFTIMGETISGAYGMPKVQFFDEWGTFIAETSAYQVAPDGTWLNVSTPDLSGVYSGKYSVEVANMTPSGTSEVIGSAHLEGYGRDRVDADGDGWFADEECNDYDPNVNPWAPPDCYGGYYDRNCNYTPDSQECGNNCNTNPYMECPIYNNY